MEKRLASISISTPNPFSENPGTTIECRWIVRDEDGRTRVEVTTASADAARAILSLPAHLLTTVDEPPIMLLIHQAGVLTTDRARTAAPVGVRVRVTDARTMQYVEDVTVTITDDATDAAPTEGVALGERDEDGYGEVAATGAPVMRVLVSAPGYQPRELRVPLTHRKRLNARLQPTE